MSVDQVAEVKGKVDIVEIIGARVNLKKAGRHFKGLCPFHSEKSPSFIVSPERQSYKCFGCQEGGDVLTFLQRYEGMSFLESLESLAARAGVTLESYRPTEADSRRRRILELLSLASEYYRYILKQHQSGEVAQEYLKKRGISSESIEQYTLGYAPAQWRSVSDFLIQKKNFSVDELEAAGLIIVGDGGKYYDRFRGRIMFPLRDHKGGIVGFSGRTLSSDTREAKYINSPETAVYHKSRLLYGLYENRETIRKEDKIVLVEGELDVIPSAQAGVRACVAIKGSAFTAEQAQIISRYTRNVYMSLDADAAGNEAIKRAVSIAETYDLSIRVVQITGGKDPGDVATENPRAWREMVKGAVLYWDFLIQSATASIDPKSGAGVESITREVVPALSQITNRVVQDHYVHKLATTLGVTDDAIYGEMARIVKKKELSNLKSVVSQIEQGGVRRADELSEYLLSLALQHYDRLRSYVTKVETHWLTHTATAKIFDKLIALGDAPFVITTFAATLPEELLPTLDQAYLRDLLRVQDAVKEWEVTVRELENLYVRDRLKEITAQLSGATTATEEQVKALQNDFGRLSRRLSELTK